MTITMIKPGRKIAERAKCQCHNCGAIFEATKFDATEVHLLLKGRLTMTCQTQYCGIYCGTQITLKEYVPIPPMPREEMDANADLPASKRMA